MDRPRWALVGALLVSIALLAAAAGGTSRQPGPAFAADDPDPPYVEVTGRGEVPAVPDLAQVRLAVSREAGTAAQAHAAAARAVQAVARTLREAGVAEKDVQTSGVNLYPEYEYVEREGQRLRGYRAQVTLTVTVRQIDRAGAVIDAAVGAGANEVHGLTLTLADPAAAQREALARAVADARSRAEALVGAAGTGLGTPLWIVDQEVALPPVEVPVARAAAEADSALRLMPGEVTVRAVVRVRFALGR